MLIPSSKYFRYHKRTAKRNTIEDSAPSQVYLFSLLQIFLAWQQMSNQECLFLPLWYLISPMILPFSFLSLKQHLDEWVSHKSCTKTLLGWTWEENQPGWPFHYYDYPIMSANYQLTCLSCYDDLLSIFLLHNLQRSL